MSYHDLTPNLQHYLVATMTCHLNWRTSPDAILKLMGVCRSWRLSAASALTVYDDDSTQFPCMTPQNPAIFGPTARIALAVYHLGHRMHERLLTFNQTTEDMIESALEQPFFEGVKGPLTSILNWLQKVRSTDRWAAPDNNVFPGINRLNKTLPGMGALLSSVVARTMRIQKMQPAIGNAWVVVWHEQQATQHLSDKAMHKVRGDTEAYEETVARAGPLMMQAELAVKATDMGQFSYDRNAAKRLYDAACKRVRDELRHFAAAKRRKNDE